jgi:uncharacterized protein (TIGR03545 family)
MTTSTETKTAKTPKKKGPLRLEAIIPIVVIGGLLFGYARLFMDSNIRRAIEIGGGMVHGAEINVASVSTSLIGGRLSIKGIQVTDKEAPELNLVSVAEVRFQFLWDALLRAKFVVEDAAISGIELKSKRKRPGEIYPVEVVEQSPSAAAQAANEVKKTVLAQSQSEFEGNVFGDLAGILGGGDAKEQLDSIRGDLKSEKHIAELEALLDQRKGEWEGALDGAKQKAELDDIKAKIKALKNNKNPLAVIKDGKQLADQIKAKSKEVKELSSGMKRDLDTFKKGMAKIDDLVKEDLAALQSRAGIPDLDPKDFAQKIFGRMVQEKLAAYATYMEMARRYMPAKKDKSEENKPAPRKRGEGVSYRFPITTGYPFFWLKKSSLSARGGEDDLAGEAKDFTSNPALIGRPALVNFKGNLKSQGVSGIEGKIVVDHVSKIETESFDIRVASFTTSPLKLSKSEKIGVTMKEGTAKSSVQGKFQSGALDVSLSNVFLSPAFDIKADNPKVESFIGNVLSSLSEVTLDARAQGELKALKWNIRSNLGPALSAGVKTEVNNEINAQKAKLQKQIDEKIGPQKKKLEEGVAKVKAQLDKLLAAKDEQVNELEKEAKDAGKGMIGGGEGKSDPLKSLKKKFKF